LVVDKNGDREDYMLTFSGSAAGLLHIMLRGHGLIMQLHLGFENGSFFCGFYLLKFNASVAWACL